MIELEQHLVTLALLFFTFSFFGWCMEVTLKYFQYHRFINRGFLTGPWLPIYGSGAVFITVAVGAFTQVEKGVGTTFIISFVICGIWEYFISFYLEKKYHARWWDYSQKPMNLNGRVWIGNLILFGIGGVAIYHIANPILFALYDKLPFRAQEIIAGCLLILYITDNILSHFVMKLVKVETETSEADNTEEISNEIRLMFKDRAYFYRRFADAYPEVVYRTERITARLEAIKAETERIRQEAETRVALETERVRREAEARVSEMSQRIEESKAQIAERLETTDSIKNTVIEKQDQLIELLYDSKAATEEVQKLMEEITSQKDRIRKRRLL